MDCYYEWVHVYSFMDGLINIKDAYTGEKVLFEQKFDRSRNHLIRIFLGKRPKLMNEAMNRAKFVFNENEI